MARVIGFNPVPQTDFSNGNSLLQLAELQRQNTFKSAEDTLNHFSKAVKDKNTALVQNFINQFKPEELNTDTTKQSINNYINQMNKDTGNMVDNTIYKYLDDRKDTLNKRIGDGITNTNNTAIASMNNIKAKENQENYDSNLLGSLSYIANNSTNQDEANSAKLAYEQNVANANANVRVGALLSSMGYDTKYNQALANQINSVKPMVENQLSYNFDQSMRFKDVLNNPNSTPEAKAEASKEIESLNADIARLVTKYNVHPEISQSVYNTVAKAYESYKDKEAQQVFLNGIEKQKADIAQQNAETNDLKASADMVQQSAKFNTETINARAKAVGLPDGYGNVLVNPDGSINITKGLNELSQFIQRGNTNQNQDITDTDLGNWLNKNVNSVYDKLPKNTKNTLNSLPEFFDQHKLTNNEQLYIYTQTLAGKYQDTSTWYQGSNTFKKIDEDLIAYRSINKQKNDTNYQNDITSRINIMASAENLSDEAFAMRYAKPLKELGIYPMLPKNLQFIIDGVSYNKK